MKHGLSLTELVIAAAILVAAMAPLWGLMSSSHNQVSFSAEELKACQIASEIIEQLEADCGFQPELKTWQLNSVSETEFDLDGIKLTVSSYSAELRDVSIEARVSEYKPDAANSEKIVTITVNYKRKNAPSGSLGSFYKLSAYLRQQ